MDSAKRFLAKVVPWPVEGLDHWWINIYRTFRPAGHTSDKLPMVGRPYKTMAGAISYLDWWRDKPDTNLYVCMSGQSMVSPKPTRSGKPNAMKTSENAVSLRSFWLDVDVDDTHFPTTADAFDATTKFVRAVGLPPPTFIVMTSKGFQCHWVLEDAIAADVWAPLAHGLANATRMLGFVPLDSGLIHDRARLMRVPDTFNWNYTPRMNVWLAHQGRIVEFAQMQSVLQPFAGSYSPALGRARTVTTVPGQSLLGSAFPWKPPIPFENKAMAGIVTAAPSIEEVADGCPFIRDTLNTAGAGLREPLWFNSLKVAYHTRDPRDAAHRLSNGHAGYAAAETDAKLQHVADDRQGKDLGWVQCDTIRIEGATQCATCPHLKNLQSPINFAVPRSSSPQSTGIPTGPAAPPTPPGSGPPSGVTVGSNQYWMPTSYRTDPLNRVFKRSTKAGEPDKLVCGLPMWNFYVAYDKPGEGSKSSSINFTAGLDRSRDVEMRVPYAALNSKERLASCLHEQSFDVRDADLQGFKDFMSSFIEELRSAKRDAVQAENFGWTHDRGVPVAFVYGRTRWNCNGNTAVAAPDHVLDEAYGQRGTLDNWKDACRLITDQKIPALDTLIAASFAAPLVIMTGHSGMVLSAYSLDSGVSKTAALRVSQAVWPNPTATMAGLDDTTNAVNAKLGMLRHLPFFYDEMHLAEQTAKFVSMIFAMGQGKTKQRMNRAAVLQPVKTFATLLVACSNNSMVSYITEQVRMTTAGLYRVFEIIVPHNIHGTGLINPAMAQQIFGALDNNYGCAGLKYAEFLGQNAAAVSADVAKCSRVVSDTLKATQDERFWVATVAVLLMGAQYANRLGLTQIDERQLLLFLLNAFRTMRANRKGSIVDVTTADNVKAHLLDYLNSRRSSMIVTDKLWISASPPPPGYRVQVKYPEAGRPIIGEIHIRRADEDKLLRFSETDFKNWCRDSGLSPSTMERQLLKVLGAAKRRGPIAKHTQFEISTFRDRMYEVDLGLHPDLTL